MFGGTLSHYRVIEKIGEGGMGVVYKAQDLHLNRLVALKVLPPEMVANPDRKARFAQEARAASALNHPNVVTIYDIVTENGVDFIVMEFVDGQTVDNLIPAHGMRLAQTLRIAVQTAQALSKAHAAAIVHRDLKPSNLMVTEDGMVKVLDFGLAKLAECEVPPAGEETRTETAQPKPRTAQGAVMGTSSYMSPEQAEGKPVDARSDIFSFGALLYEMASGRRAFQGDTAMSTLAAVIHQTPPRLQNAPPEFDRILRRCLQKDKQRRFQTMADLAVALQEQQEELQSGISAAPAGPPRWLKPVTWIGGTAVLALLLFAGWWLVRASGEHPIPLWSVRQLTTEEGFSTSGSLSPDGRLIVYASNRSGSGENDLWIRQIASGAPVRLTNGPYSAYFPSFSPDGSKILFTSAEANPGVYLIPAIGGEPRRIADIRHPFLSRYSPNGEWIAIFTSEERRVNFQLLPAAGGEVRNFHTSLFQTNEFSSGGRQFAWSPESDGWLFMATQTISGNDWDLWFISLSGQVTQLHASARLTAAGLGNPVPVLWQKDALLLTAVHKSTTDLWRMALSSGSHAVGSVEPVTSGWASRLITSVDPGPTRMVYADQSAARSSLWSLPLDAEQARVTGSPERIFADDHERYSPRLARSGLLAYTMGEGGHSDLWLTDLASAKDTRLTETTEDADTAIGSPDGSAVAFRVLGKGAPIMVVPVRGGAPRTICSSCGRATDWSPDGSKLLVHDLDGKAGSAGIIDLKTGRRQRLLEHRGRIFAPQVSPNGKWIVFGIQGGEEGDLGYTVPYREDRLIPENEWTPVHPGLTSGTFFQWSPGGRMLYYFAYEPDRSRSIWAIAFDPDSGKTKGDPFLVFRPETPRRLLADSNVIGMAFAKDRLYFSMRELHSSVWLAQSETNK